MSAAPRVVILNAHSVLNSGDAGILMAQIGWLRRRFPGARLAVTSRTPALDAGWLAPFDVEVFPPLVPVPSRHPGTRGGGGSSGPGRRRALLRRLRASDLVISTGGGYFYSHRRVFPGPTYWQNILHVRAALACGRPVVFFPQSFGPCLSGAARRALGRTLARPGVKAILSREEISREYLAGLLPGPVCRDRVRLCPDAAFLLEGAADAGPLPVSPDWPRPLIVATLREWPASGVGRSPAPDAAGESYLDAFEGALARLSARHGGTVAIFPHSRGPRASEDDRRISALFRERLIRRRPGASVVLIEPPPACDPRHVIAWLRSADLVLATRFHSAVFALCAGTPVLAIGYQPKARGTLRLLGLEHLALDWDGLSGTALETRAHELLAAPAETRREIARRVAEARSAIEGGLGWAVARAGL